MNHVSPIEITLTAVEANGRVFWFAGEEQARQFCRDRWDAETGAKRCAHEDVLRATWIKHYTIRSQEELVALLNQVGAAK